MKKSILKRAAAFLSIVLALFTLVPTTAYAADTVQWNIGTGTLNITSSNYANTYEVYGTSNATEDNPAHVIYIEENITANVILSGLTINQSIGTNMNSTIYVGAGTTLNLTLETGTIANLYGGIYMPAILVGDGATLNITADGIGALYAYGGSCAAGIGGAYSVIYNHPAYDSLGYEDLGVININGGTIFATGGGLDINGAGGGGAGIGSGAGWLDAIDCKDITITGGIVNATGRVGAAGIGGGQFSGLNGTIAISGGFVTATPGVDHYVSIGPGDGTNDSPDDVISISGGTVRCTDGSSTNPALYALGNSTRVYISGGTVQASFVSGSPQVSGTDLRYVYENTVEFPSPTTVRGLSLTLGGAAYPYGDEDLQTDSRRTLYLYLPSSASVTSLSVTTSSTPYTGYYRKPNWLDFKMDQGALSVTGMQSEYTAGSGINPGTSGGSGGGAVSYSYAGRSGTVYGPTGTAPSGVGNYTVTATKAEDDSYYPATASYDFGIIPAPSTLVGVISPIAITNVANGTPKDDSALGLPSTVMLSTDNGNVSGDVAWDVDGCSYNPALTAEQTFTVDGTVTLPGGVINPNGVSLDVSIDVTVNAAASTDKTLISIATPSSITGAANGTAKTAPALGLPEKVILDTDGGDVQADVTWDVDGCSYNPALTTEQTFTVDGSVTLPGGVINPNGVSLNVSIDVTVNAAASTDKTLEGVTEPTAITGVANGTAKTASALGLPEKVTLDTDGGDVQADVIWDVDGSAYDPGIIAEQTFAVDGNVTLPGGVINPNGISLNVAISVTVNAATVTPTYIIAASAGSGGSISPSGEVFVTEGGNQTFTITPNANYVIESVRVDGVNQGAISSHTFTNVTAGHAISATFRYTGSGGGDRSQPTYIFRTLTDSPTGVTVSGSIHRRATLTVKDMALHPEGACDACDAIRKAQNGNQFILGFGIDLTRGFRGPLTISIPVGNRYNGRAVTVLHCANGRLETLTATVANGEMVFTVTDLSLFAVTTGLLVPDSVVIDPPKTGGGSSNLVGWLLCGASAAEVAALTVLGKRRKPYKR